MYILSPMCKRNLTMQVLKISTVVVNRVKQAGKMDQHQSCEILQSKQTSHQTGVLHAPHKNL